MISKTLSKLTILIFLFSCSYQPIYSNKEYLFNFGKFNMSGSEKVNNVIKRKLENIKGQTISYNIILESQVEKNVISNDNKGDPSMFELVIKSKYIIKENSETLLNSKINKKVTYSNISDKFELSNYENNLISNLSNTIAEEILFSVSNKNK